MWLEKGANLRDYTKYLFKRKGLRIGFCTDILDNYSFIKPFFMKYNNFWASTRLRVNDIIYNTLYSKKINARFFNPMRKFDILIFQKFFSRKAYLIASKYKKMGTIIILDINVNYFDTTSDYIAKQMQNNRDLLKFLNVTDKIITTTDYLKDYIIKNDIFSDVSVIPEIISPQFFSLKKEHVEKKKVFLLYVGYAFKALELEIIKEPLEELNKTYDLSLILICEKKPEINIDINKIYIKYYQHRLPMDMIKGDIFLAPRDLSESYNLGHSFTKIGYPMALGIPVVASPVPSYLKSPAIICEENIHWYEKLEELVNNFELRNALGNEGLLNCKKYYSKNVVLKKYLDLLE